MLGRGGCKYLTYRLGAETCFVFVVVVVVVIRVASC